MDIVTDLCYDICVCIYEFFATIHAAAYGASRLSAQSSEPVMQAVAHSSAHVHENYLRRNKDAKENQQYTLQGYP